MDLSIIIVSYNTKKLTIQCIDSIYSSKVKTRFEVIIVDNASSDGTVEWFQKTKSRYKNLTFISNDENLGFSKANNLGINVAKGKHVMLLNSDTIVLPNSIDKLYNFASKTPDAGVVGPKLLNEDRTTQESAFNFPSIRKAIQQHWLRQGNPLDKYTPKGTDPVAVDILIMAAFLITPKALSKVGNLDEKYFMYFEDFDYCRRVYQTELKVYYLPTAEIVHLHGSSGKNLATNKDQWKRLIPSAKIYYGLPGYYIRWFITRAAQALNNRK